MTGLFFLTGHLSGGDRQCLCFGRFPTVCKGQWCCDSLLYKGSEDDDEGLEVEVTG